MTNRECQKARDNEKWKESQAEGYDMAGAMPWCAHCEFSHDAVTKTSKICTHKSTDITYPCATAWNRMKANRKLCR